MDPLLEPELLSVDEPLSELDPLLPDELLPFPPLLPDELLPDPESLWAEDPVVVSV